MEPYVHRRQRPLHPYRHGWWHYTQHRDGHHHGHRRRSRRHSIKQQRTPRESLRRSGRYLRGRWPLEIARQIAVGALLALAVVFVVCSIWGLLTILQAKNDLRGAQSEATSLAVDRTQLFTATGRANATQQIVKMQEGTDNAANLVNNSIPLQVLSWIPFVGQQVNGVTSLVNDFDTTSQQAGTLLTSVNQLIGASHATSISLPELKFLDVRVHQAVAVLRPLNRGSGLLIGPLASARDTFDSEITKITALLSTGGDLLNYVGPFLGADGPRTYLLAGENNAEMRDQGAVLSWALLTANNGTFSMSHAASVGTLTIQHPAPLRLPKGTQEAFGDLQPEQIWQSVNATADFPLSGEVMAAMYHQRTHKSVDGVIAVDAIALQHVLDVTGPVHVKVKGKRLKVTPSNVLYVLLHGLYLLYPKNYEEGTRHDEVSAVASAAVARMKHHAYDIAFLVDQLAKAAQGRHLLVWSRFPVLENAVTRFGGSGSLVAQSTSVVHLAIESAVAAKLDWYVHTRANYTVSIDSDGAATISVKVVVDNKAPVGCRPHYVCGPDHTNSFVRGQYVARLDLWLPATTVVPGGVSESGLTLWRAEVNVMPTHKETLLVTGFIPHAVKNGGFSLQFIPQSGLYPQLSKIALSAPGWSVSGPSQKHWYLKAPITYGWQLSR
ncbi:MAG TPA: DUF4012 domain-containing protein [Acidimicrobiales bacterium]|jgi:hypothetical protein|nr:DUF4012 domain-containing protein [Acidimicrobiales bacterium]